MLHTEEAGISARTERVAAPMFHSFVKQDRDMQALTKLDTYDGETGFLNVIVETPQGSHNKYNYDEKLQLFRISCMMPAGSVFPYDFGFIPSTLGDDGDPMDVLVLMEH